MNRRSKWHRPVQKPAKPAAKVVWDEFDAEAARDGAAIRRAFELRPRTPKRVK